jgi:hypothetical protein
MAKKYKARIQFGDSLLITTAGLLGALRDADEFPQDRAGIEDLIAGAPKGPDGEELWATYEEPDAPITYLGGTGTWVAPAGGGRLRVRMVGADGLASQIWILGPDGALSDPETIEGYDVLEDELPESARADLEEIERRRQRALARMPEMERRNEEERNRFRVEHLLGVVAGPVGQDQSGPMLGHVVLYDTGLIVNYLLPRSVEDDVDPEEPWEFDVPEPKIRLDDGLGTEFTGRGGSIDRNGSGPLRCKREFTPAAAHAATRLLIEIGSASVEIDLGSA